MARSPASGRPDLGPGRVPAQLSYGPAWLTVVMMTNSTRSRMRRPRALGDHEQDAFRLLPRLGSTGGELRRRAPGRPPRAELDIDPAELRRRNFVPPEHFPYTGLFHRSTMAATPSPSRALGRYDDWRARREAARTEGSSLASDSPSSSRTPLGPSRKMNVGGVIQGGYDISKSASNRTAT